jgi:hypothetical protein
MGLERLCTRFARMPDRSGRHVGSCLHCGASAGPRRYRGNLPGRAHTLPGGTKASPRARQRPAVFIPTGLYIESIQFKGPYTVQVSGYVWQRYANDLPKGIDEGFVMPEAQYARFFKVYQAQQGNEKLIGWSFFATLREQFDYKEYPLDRQQIRIELWHKDFERNVYLAPDFGGYTSLDPAALPALDKDVVLED